jgi:creatinine amidohydrolase
MTKGPARRPVTRFQLCVADDETFWPWFSSPVLAAWPEKERTVVVIPMAGMADWGIGHPLDAEELVLLDVLRRASLDRPVGLRLLVAPPLRFVLGPDAGCAFALDVPTAHAQVADIVSSIVSSGFRRIVLYNSSPWNEELCAASSRDLRLQHGASVFRVHLSALGLDFHPSRSRDRRLVQTAVTALTGRPPEAGQGGAETVCAEEWGTERVAPLGGPPLPLEQARSDGMAALEAAASRLRSLLGEISESRAPSKAPSPTGTGLGMVADEAPAGREPPLPATSPSCRARYLPAMTARQIAELPDKAGALVLLATGAVEQHGPHLPVAVDSLLGQAWLSLALEKLPATVACYVAPPITIGKSYEHTGYAGTLSVSKETLRKTLLAVARQVYDWGFRKLAVVNTHGGNTAVIVTVLREIRRDPGLRAGLLRTDEELGISAQEAAYGMHAGEVETSWMLAAAPALVDLSAAVCEYPSRLEDPGEVRPELAPATFGWTTRDLSASGVMGDASAATRAKGERWMALRAESLARAILRLCL